MWKISAIASIVKHYAMAEIMAPGKPGKRKKASLRIDLTPMVDLGFLLITFFMFTTTLAKPKALQMTMPTNDHPDPPTVFVKEATITLIPTHDHKIAYYNGTLDYPAQLQYATITQARDVLLHKQKEVAALPPSFSVDAHKLHVLIKPNSDCTYNDVVALLDEMNILAIEHYAMVDVTADEQAALKK